MIQLNDAYAKKRQELANYFDEATKGDIFDYTPPQRTNQIFIPKRVQLCDTLPAAKEGKLSETLQEVFGV